jgi:hypothetical protein
LKILKEIVSRFRSKDRGVKPPDKKNLNIFYFFTQKLFLPFVLLYKVAEKDFPIAGFP